MSSSDAAADKLVAADPKLEKALKAAAASANSAGSDDGPPPAGVFAPGVGDRRHPKSSPTKVDLIGEGSEPRLVLGVGASDAGPGGAAAVAGPAVLEVAVQVGPRSALPTVDFGLHLAAAKKDEGSEGSLVAIVKKATPAKEQYGTLPAGIDKAIAALQGTRIVIPFAGSAPESNVQTALAKDAPPELERLATNAAEALVFDTVPAPTKAVGAGAQWIAETRMSWAGVDVIAYRAFRVKSIDGSRATLTFDAKAYAVEKQPAFQGLPKGASLEQFDAEAQGELEVVAGEGLARRSSMQQRAAMLFRTAGAAGAAASGAAGAGGPEGAGEAAQNMATLQTQALASFARGDDLRAATR